MRDTIGGITTRVSLATNGVQGNYTASEPSMSADGRFVSFDSYSNNLVLADTNHNWDIFVHDRYPPPTATGDFAGDGWADLIARQTSSGSHTSTPATEWGSRHGHGSGPAGTR